MVPFPTALANPYELMVATPVAVEAQVAVQDCVEPSENTRVAVYCKVVLMLIVLFGGVIVTLEGVGGGGPGAVTVTTVFPETAPSVAEMVEVPAAIPETSPVLDTVAFAVTVEAHTGAEHVRLEPSL